MNIVAQWPSSLPFAFCFAAETRVSTVSAPSAATAVTLRVPATTAAPDPPIYLLTAHILTRAVGRLTAADCRVENILPATIFPIEDWIAAASELEGEKTVANYRLEEVGLQLFVLEKPLANYIGSTEGGDAAFGGWVHD